MSGEPGADLTACREQREQAKSLASASALERAEHTSPEAKAKAKAESRKRPMRLVEGKPREQPEEKIKWKKERKRRRRRSHNPRVTLKSVPGEAAPIRLRPAARPVRGYLGSISREHLAASFRYVDDLLQT